MLAGWLAGSLAAGLLACGPVRVGDLPSEVEAPGADDASALDPRAPSVAVRVRAPASCNGCFDLLAEAQGGSPPYVMDWDDGSHEASRLLCPNERALTATVTVRDAAGARSAAHTTSLEPADAGCPQDASLPKLLSLENTSFEGTAGINTGFPDTFTTTPAWSACTNPSQTNTPEILNENVDIVVTKPLQPRDGASYLGLTEGEQVSQKLLESIPGGSARSFMLDLGRLNITAGLVPDTEKAFLEVWGGTSGDCSARELLWASPALALKWEPYCITIRPQQFMDNLILRAAADGTRGTIIYVVADHLVPVTTCPSP